MKILLVDDEKNILESVSRALTRMGYEVITADGFNEAIEALDGSFEAALLDVWLNDGDGVKLLKIFKDQFPDLAIIMISGHSTIATAVEAIKHGAYDFLEKPLSLDKLEVLLQNVAELNSLRKQRDMLLARLDDEVKLVGKSQAVEDLLEIIKKFAPEEAHVLITGESGSGKELVARLIHHNSLRNKGPFVALNCAALPEELAEAELFGYEKGSFTGAVKSHEGHFRKASGGVLFLDEISEMSPRLQAKLLRVIEDRKVTPLGGKSTFDIDIRLIAASNRNLKDLVASGDFRQDLYFRLNVLPINVPPLRERIGDIGLLADYFCNRYSFKTNKKPRKIAKSGLALLEKLNYPGNIRELKNYIERILILTESDRVEADDIMRVLPGLMDGDTKQVSMLKQAVEEFERDYILKAIRGSNGNIARAARILGLERSHLYKKMKSHGIEREEN
jgi:two-component system nitrogen regulation response regulator NtrX